jgi:hypothetical protein
MDQTTQPTLTSHQAYLVMFKFLRRYYERGQSDEIGGLLGGLQLLPDGQSADPAYYSHDWEMAVRDVLAAESTAMGHGEVDFKLTS